MNQCILTGNLGADPELRYSQDGVPVASFSLAFKPTKDRTGWIKVVCFSKQAEVAERYLHKGAKIILLSTVDQSRWETETGEQKSSMQLIAQRIEFIKTDGRGFEGEEDHHQ